MWPLCFCTPIIDSVEMTALSSIGRGTVRSFLRLGAAPRGWAYEAVALHAPGTSVLYAAERAGTVSRKGGLLADSYNVAWDRAVTFISSSYSAGFTVGSITVDTDYRRLSSGYEVHRPIPETGIPKPEMIVIFAGPGFVIISLRLALRACNSHDSNAELIRLFKCALVLRAGGLSALGIYLKGVLFWCLRHRGGRPVDSRFRGSGDLGAAQCYEIVY